MKELVTLKEGVPVVDSRKVAECFDKEHFIVNRDIDKIITDVKEVYIEETASNQAAYKIVGSENADAFIKNFFIRGEYADVTGKRNRMFFLTEDGFNLLAMGFTGKKALKWKLSFLAEFNRLRANYAARPSIADSVSEVERITFSLNNAFDVQKPLAAAKAITLVEGAHGVNLDPIKELLPPATHNPGRLNPTALGALIGNKPGKIVNKLLAAAGLQFNAGGKWILTPEGKKYGEMVPFCNKNGHADYRPLWSPEVVNVILA